MVMQDGRTWTSSGQSTCWKDFLCYSGLRKIWQVLLRVATESCCQISQFGSHYWELPSHDSLLDSDYCPLSKASRGFVFETYADYFLAFIGLL